MFDRESLVSLGDNYQWFLVILAIMLKALIVLWLLKLGR